MFFFYKGVSNKYDNGWFKVDLNRNFPLGFGLGADDNPCSEVYKGQVLFLLLLLLLLLTKALFLKLTLAIVFFWYCCCWCWPYRSPCQSQKQKHSNWLQVCFSSVIIKSNSTNALRLLFTDIMTFFQNPEIFTNITNMFINQQTGRLNNTLLAYISLHAYGQVAYNR